MKIKEVEKVFLKNDNKRPTFALCGNPNSGKTSLFNALTGSHQHVGNWGGVTVEIKTGTAYFNNKECTIVDLPGTYSLSAYTIEEKLVTDFLLQEKPDVVINVVDATNLERNLYLTVQLFELGIRPLLVLNMWDEVQKKNITIDTTMLSHLLDVPVVTTIGKTGENIELLLSKAFEMVENREECVYKRHGTWFSPEIEKAIDSLLHNPTIKEFSHYPPRWFVIKLLEGDNELLNIVSSCKECKPFVEKIKKSIDSLHLLFGEDPQTLIAEARYGFINGAIRECVTKKYTNKIDFSEQIDRILTHQFWAFPIFLFFMWLLFQATFNIGKYPAWILEQLITLSKKISLTLLPDNLLRSLIIEGILGGIGNVIVFLPNILILFLGIAIMEDTGYMARAAFITDRIMHKVGLHGKSFIPLLMGMGCNVPAIMAARTLESELERRKTILLTPLVSCSARLPVYVLFAGALFPKHAGNIVFLFQFIIGTMMFFIMAYVFKKTLFRGEEHPFVMELPPYRIPTLRSIIIHMWLNTEHFLKKMGGVVLIFSIIFWALGKFPQSKELEQKYQLLISETQNSLLSEEEKRKKTIELQQEFSLEKVKYSFIGRFGSFLAPLFRPLGFEWREAVSLISGFVAKEAVVSSMGVLYASAENGYEEELLLSAIRKNFTPLKGFAFMLFVLLYTPCIVALITVIRELHSIKSVSYT
ncbi:MAG: ferrous iron transport protein B, partial [Chitinispirillaceae bacterium]|nr:ferrous iron transport protein B [Chitinispirillaceae bacterium]